MPLTELGSRARAGPWGLTALLQDMGFGLRLRTKIRLEIKGESSG